MKIKVVKEAEERRNEILDAADELLGQKGFDCTSTNDILDKVEMTDEERTSRIQAFVNYTKERGFFYE